MSMAHYAFVTCLPTGKPWISNEDILRLKLFDENLGFATIVCRLGSYIHKSSSRSQDESNVFATDKHRMLWVIDMKTLSNIGSTGKAQSTYPRDARLNRSDVCPEFLDVAYQKGTLHVIKAAPKRDYSTRITLEPCLSASGEYENTHLDNGTCTDGTKDQTNMRAHLHIRTR